MMCREPPNFLVTDTGDLKQIEIFSNLATRRKTKKTRRREKTFEETCEPEKGFNLLHSQDFGYHSVHRASICVLLELGSVQDEEDICWMFFSQSRNFRKMLRCRAVVRRYGRCRELYSPGGRRQGPSSSLLKSECHTASVMSFVDVLLDSDTSRDSTIVLSTRTIYFFHFF